MIAAMSAGYPSQESVGVWFTVVLLGFLALGGVVAWLAGRPYERKTAAPVRFDVPCDCGKASSNCTRKEDGSCG